MIIKPNVMESVMAKMRILPARPATHRDVLKALENADFSASEIARKINQDVALTAHVLKMANSVLFAPTEKISSTSQAVSMIGTMRIKGLVSTAWAFQLLDESKKVPGFDPRTEWHHALEVGSQCLEMAKSVHCDSKTEDEAFSAALLHDVGKVLIAVNMPEVFAAVTEEAEERKLGRWLVEQEMLGFDHADLGAQVLKGWDMPEQIVTAVREHHQPGEDTVKTFNPLILVHLSNCKVMGIEPHAECFGRYCVAKMVWERLSHSG
jgi:putative nucleotidyltransferase with HDIG domain